jgi:UPF0176 protein
MKNYTVKTLYSFTPQKESELERLKLELTNLANRMNCIGLLILGREGFNTTLASQNPEDLDSLIEAIKTLLQTTKTSLIKTSHSSKKPFRRFDVKIRPEIVTLEREDLFPQEETHRHLSPSEWNEMLQRDDVVVIDTRNDYEVKIGKFKKAMDFNISEFTEFPDKIKSLDTNKETPHLIYCTGGIRCEKAIYEMESQGFKNVYQLEGGILNYIEHFPNKEFEGECFVFDSRVALDQNLEPSKIFSLCPHCGDVSDIDITCVRCDSPSKLCNHCYAIANEQKELMTCSKNCKYHYKLHPERKAQQQKLFFHS